MKKIILVGSGEIGSRHLQAISKLPFKVQINVVEKNLEKFNIAKKRLRQINFDETYHDLRYFQNIDELSEKSDLVIIATNSDIRNEITSNLIKLGHKRFLLEKIVTQTKNDYQSLLKKIETSNAKAWIDMARSNMKSYQEIKRIFKNSHPIHMTVNRGNRGLGTNAIHFLNLFSYFCDDYNIFLNGDFLDEKIYPNKRGKKYVEFSGTLIGKNNFGSTFTITFSQHNEIPLTISIMGKNKHLIIEEETEQMYFLKGGKNSKIKFKNELQSSISTKIISDIIKKLSWQKQKMHLIKKSKFRSFNR